MTSRLDFSTVPSPSTNGNGHTPTATHVPTKRVRKAKVAPLASEPAKATRRQLSSRRRIALAVGGCGCFVLALSVSHCTAALVLTTGQSWWMAALLAVGIDCGMVAAEVASTVAGKSARLWARCYVGLAVVLSMALNAIASAQGATDGFAPLAYLVGAVVPVLVLILGTVASKLWTEEDGR